MENKASLSALGSYQDLEVGSRGPLIPSLGPAQEKSMLCGYVEDGGGGSSQILHPVAS